MSHPLPDMMDTSIGKIREMVDANTVVGTPITTPDGVTVIPISSIKVGFASGGSDFPAKNGASANPFGGGAGGGVTVTPVAFLVIKEGSVRMLPVEGAGGDSPVDRLLELLPELVQKVNDLIANRKKKKDAQDADFEDPELPEE